MRNSFPQSSELIVISKHTNVLKITAHYQIIQISTDNSRFIMTPICQGKRNLLTLDSSLFSFFNFQCNGVNPEKQNMSLSQYPKDIGKSKLETNGKLQI